MMTDPIADMLTRIRNALAADHPTVEMPASKEKEAIARVLRKEGFIDDFRAAGEAPRRLLKVYLRYGPLGEKVISKIERISKPGRRIYRGAGELPRIANGIGMVVVSTSHGVMSDRECRKLHVGGELLCSVI